MSAAELLADLTRLGIRIEANGDRLRYSPRSAVTPDLADQLKANKGELMSMLRTGGVPGPVGPAVVTSIPSDGKWHTVFDVTQGEYDWINEAFDIPIKFPT